MLQKTNNEAIERVRSDPRVREALRVYRKIHTDPEDVRKFMRFLYGKKHKFEPWLLWAVVGQIGKAYY